MADNLTIEQRSKCMSRIRSKWTAQEKKIHNHMKGLKIQHLMHPNLPGKPDLLLKKTNTVIFLHGCFWHKCNLHYKEPKSRKEYWVPKIQKNVQNAEPIIRNADILSVDVSSVRNSEFSSNNNSGPNGFYGDEVCQLMRYAGMSDKLSSIGFYEFNPNTGDSKMSAKLIAQMIWCVVDGHTNRKKDYPIGTKEKYTRYRVHVEGTEHELVFYKSDKTDRWWMDVPYPPDDRVRFERHHLVPCTYEEYRDSSDNNIPDLWWRTYRKLN